MFETSSGFSSDVSSLSIPMNSIGSGVYSILGIIFVVAIIITIVILVKSILDKKKLNAELTIETINAVKTTAIILIVVNALSIITNCLAILMLIMPIISVVFTSNAKNMIETNPEVAKSKANTAGILNIISAVLPIVGFILSFGAVFILNSMAGLM